MPSGASAGGGSGGGSSGGAGGGRKCSLRALVVPVQALFLRWLLFPPSAVPAQASASNPVPRTGRSGAHSAPPPDMPADKLRATALEQREALSMALASALWRCVGERSIATVALPVAPPLPPPLTPSSALLPDGITERLMFFQAASLDDLRLLVRRFIYVFQEENGPGCLCLLYSAVLTRGIDRVLQDLDGAQDWLLGVEDEGSPCIVTLLLTGRATPYLHNGVVYVGDEEHYALPRFGVLSRAEVGLLLWAGGEDDGGGSIGTDEGPGSRLKTPQLPVWVSAAQGHFGVLFATDRELLRNYHAERSFQLHYYCLEATPCLLGVDTNYAGNGGGDGVEGEAPRRRVDEASRTPVERVICTKWPDAQVTWLKLPGTACPRLTL